MAFDIRLRPLLFGVGASSGDMGLGVQSGKISSILGIFSFIVGRFGVELCALPAPRTPLALAIIQPGARPHVFPRAAHFPHGVFRSQKLLPSRHL